MTVKIKQPKIKFRSVLEQVAWNEWLPTQEYKQAQYEPIKFNCAGGLYTPDIVLTLQDDTLLFVEVKGSWRARGGDRSKRILREAAGQFSHWGKFIALLPRKTRKIKEAPGLYVGEWITEEFN